MVEPVSVDLQTLHWVEHGAFCSAIYIILPKTESHFAWQQGFATNKNGTHKKSA